MGWGTAPAAAPSGAEPSVGEPSGAEPSGAEPSGAEPSGAEPSEEVEEAVRPGVVARLRRWALRRPRRALVLLGGPVLLAVSAAFGGLDAVREAPELDAVAVGKPVETGPLRVTVTGARVTKGRLGPVTAEAPADRWVVVLATVEVTGESSSNVIGKYVKLEGVNGVVKKDPELLSVDDGYFVDYLHPGLPARLAFAWPQDAKAEVPQRLRVRLIGAEYRRDTIGGELGWWGDHDVAIVRDVPVVDRRDAP